MIVLYLWAGNLQAMVPSHIQCQTRGAPLQIGQSAATHHSHLVARVMHQRGQYLLHRRTQVCCRRVGHERSQGPVIIEEQCTPLRPYKAWEYDLEVLPER